MSTDAHTFIIKLVLCASAFVQVPCRQAGVSSEENLEKFKNEFPVVSFIGTPKLLDSTQPFKVDDGVQLVCKYLKRFDTNRIDVTLPSM